MTCKHLKTCTTCKFVFAPIGATDEELAREDAKFYCSSGCYFLRLDYSIRYVREIPISGDRKWFYALKGEYPRVA